MSPQKTWSPRKPGQFGAKVIGEDLAAEQADIRKKKKNVFGPKVFGDKVDDRDEGERLAAKVGLKPEHDNEEVDAAIAAAAGEDGYLSVKDVRKALEEGPPATFDRLLDAELQRTPPRKTALRHFLEKETQREDGPRAPVLKVLEGALAGRSES